MLAPAPSLSFEKSAKCDDTTSEMSTKCDDTDESLPTAPPPPVHDSSRVRAWTTLFGAWLAIAATFGYTLSFGVYQLVYTRADVASATGVRWIGATQLSLLLATSLPAGLLHDYGHFRCAVIGGSYLFTSSLFMLSTIDLGDEYFTFLYVQGISMSIGAGMVFVPSLAVQTDHWGARSTLAMGIASTGLFAGGAFFPIMLTQLLRRGVSFAWTVRASAFVVLGMLLVANACMRRSCPGASSPTGAKRTSLTDLVTDAAYMFAALAGLFMSWGIYFTYFYLQRCVIDRGMDRAFAFYTPAILCGAALAGGLLSNLAATKCGTINMFAVMALFCFLFLHLAFVPKTITGVALNASIAGLLSGAWFSLLPPVLHMTSTSKRDCGLCLGFAFAVSAVAVLASTPLNEWLLEPVPRPYSYLDWGLPNVISTVLLALLNEWLLAPAPRPHSDWDLPNVISIFMMMVGAFMCMMVRFVWGFRLLNMKNYTEVF
ncbi:MFS general substrate transporter [Auriscalpium vulgare]|uniref:MFS general substrate transporter n=1 Tax=Auriscalpium vulgare TaxID=40419 RepID=A0ACB8RH12_9AGAM|nr:MFS general substrate transporter [Auriscalpium vulgare]